MNAEEPMSIEDRVRTATRAGATLVRDIGPMAAAPEKIRARRRPAPTARRWGSWGIPLVAAAAVVLVALTLVAVRQFGATDRPANRPAPTAPAAVPRYYVALDLRDTSSAGTTGSGDVIVGDDLTGKAIAVVDPPRGVIFDRVEGASDDRTFVVMATSGTLPGSPPYSWYLLRIAPGTAHPYQLSELPIKLPGSSPGILAYALSPGNRELAVESIGPNNSSNILTVALYSASSGAELRAWTSEPGSGPVQLTLSWLSDGRQLAFSDLPPGDDPSGQEVNQLRILDVAGSDTNLLTASRVLLTLKSPNSSPSNCQSLQLTPDGGTIICGTQYALLDGGPGTSAGCAGGGLEFTAYSVRTGKPDHVLYQYRGTCANGISYVLWTAPSATTIIGATETDVHNLGGKQAGQLGVITDGHIRLLKLPASVSPANYANVAF